MLRAFSQASRCRVARQFDGSVTAAPSTTPRTPEDEAALTLSDLAGRLPDGADAEALEDRAVLEHEDGGRARLAPAARLGVVLQHRHVLFKAAGLDGRA